MAGLGGLMPPTIPIYNVPNAEGGYMKLFTVKGNGRAVAFISIHRYLNQTSGVLVIDIRPRSSTPILHTWLIGGKEAGEFSAKVFYYKEGTSISIYITTPYGDSTTPNTSFIFTIKTETIVDIVSSSLPNGTIQL